MSSDPVGFWARRRSVRGPPARRQEKRTAARRLSFRAARCIELDSEGPPLRNRVRKRRWFGQPEAHKIVARPTVGDSRGWSDSASCLATSISSQHTRLGMRRTGGRARFMPAWGLWSRHEWTSSCKIQDPNRKGRAEAHPFALTGVVGFFRSWRPRRT